MKYNSPGLELNVMTTPPLAGSWSMEVISKGATPKTT